MTPAVQALPCLADRELHRALDGLGGVLHVIDLPEPLGSSHQRGCAEGETDAQCIARALDELRRDVPLGSGWEVEARASRRTRDLPETARLRVDGEARSLMGSSALNLDGQLEQLAAQGHIVEILGRERHEPVQERTVLASFQWRSRVPLPRVAHLLWSSELSTQEAKQRLAVVRHDAPGVAVASWPPHAVTGWTHSHLAIACSGEDPVRARLPAPRGWFCTDLPSSYGGLHCTRTREECEADRTGVLLYRRGRTYEEQQARAVAEDVGPPEPPPGPCTPAPRMLCRTWSLQNVAGNAYLKCYATEEACKADEGRLDVEPTSACEIWE